MNMRSALRLPTASLLLILPALGLVPALARAQPKAPPPASPASPGSEDQSVESLVARAQAASRAGDHAQAESLWTAAYARQPQPEYLLQIGDAARQVGGPAATARALRAYRRYLNEETQPDPADRLRVLSIIRELSERAHEPPPGPAQGPMDPNRPAVRGVAPAPDYQRSRADAPAQRLSMTAPPPKAMDQVILRPVPAPGTPAERSALRLRRAGLGLLFGGTLLGAVGGTLLGTSVSTAHDARKAPDYASYLEGRESALRLLGGGIACLSLAGAAVLAGSGVLLLGPRGAPPAAKERAARLSLTPLGAGLALTLTPAPGGAL
jgi:hypothetical protein